MTTKNILVSVVSLVVVVAIGYVVYSKTLATPLAQIPEATPNYVTLSGTVTCLPHSDQSRPGTKECMTALKTDDGVYYALEYATSTSPDAVAGAEHIRAQGYVVNKAALDSNVWGKYLMDGMFTVTTILTDNTEIK